MEHVVPFEEALAQFEFGNTHAITVHFVNGYVIILKRKIGGLPDVYCYVSDDVYLHVKPIQPATDMSSVGLHDLIVTLERFLFDKDDIKEMLTLTDQDYLTIRNNMQPFL